MGSWKVGKLESLKVGKLGRWEVGKLGRWEVGKLESWEVGKVLRWEVETLHAMGVRCVVWAKWGRKKDKKKFVPFLGFFVPVWWW